VSHGRVVVACLLLLAVLAAPAAAKPDAPLGHQGRWITDAQGRVVILHGFNLAIKSPPYDPALAGFGADDAEFLASEGFNSIRLGLFYEALEPLPGVINTEYLERLAAVEETLAANDQFTLLDMHQDFYGRRFGGEGFPDWATIDDGLPRSPNSGDLFGYATVPGLQRAFDHFWANDVGIQASYANAWGRVAERFRGRPHLIGYDIFNTPWPGSDWPSCASAAGCPVFDATKLTPFTNRVLNRIRSNDPRSLVFYEPHAAFDYGAESHHGDTGDNRAGFSFHSHCLAATEGGTTLPVGSIACPVNHDQVFENAEIQSEATGDALYLTDFGARNDLAELERLLSTADRFMVSWANWSYVNLLPNGDFEPVESLLRDPTKPPSADNVRQDLLEHLVRPYPQAVAGTPLRWTFDPVTRAFEFDYEVLRPDGSPVGGGQETEVFMPRRHYSGGYDLEVKGANAVSQQDASALRLVAAPGAQVVTVRASAARRGLGPESGVGCIDGHAPRTRVKRRSLRLSQSSVRIRGRARDVSACATSARAGRLAAVEISLSRRVGKSCRHLDSRKRFGAPRDCGQRAWKKARGKSRWRFKRRLRLKPGRYVLGVRARDREGNLERLKRRNVLRRRVR
jgi:endoglycosylceramidase